MMKTTSYAAPQPGDFAFSGDNLQRAKSICARYPADRQASATIALLDLAQRQNGGWLSGAAIEYVAQYLAIAPIRVFEVASFYSMFNMKAVGKHFIQVCRTTPCWLRGSDGITEACKKKLGVGLREVTPDGLFSIVEVECLGACANAPMAQINDLYYEDLTPQLMVEIIDRLRIGEEVTPGSQTGRLASAPEGGPQTLLNVPERRGSAAPGDRGAGAGGDD